MILPTMNTFESRGYVAANRLMVACTFPTFSWLLAVAMYVTPALAFIAFDAVYAQYIQRAPFYKSFPSTYGANLWGCYPLPKGRDLWWYKSSVWGLDVFYLWVCGV